MPVQGPHEREQVERSPVEGGDLVRGLELLAQDVEERSLEARLRQEDLSDAQPAVDRARDRGGEHQRSRAAAETGRLGVEVRDVAGVWLQRRQRDYVLAQHRSAVRRRDLLEAAR